MERLNKLLARAGVASRRAADRLIAGGHVTVNGERVTELGVRVDPDADAIKVDGKRIGPFPRTHVYYLLNKPRGYLTTMSDPEGRPTIREMLGGIKRRVYPVGRLDFQSEGLLLLTDDGELARALMHPGSGVPKTYSVKVRGTPCPEALKRLAAGISIEGRRTMPARIRLKRPGANAWLQVTVVEGRKHQVRKMLDAIGHRVLKLKRVSYAGIDLGDLPAGAVRPLTRGELARLRGAVAGSASPSRGAARRPPRPA